MTKNTAKTAGGLFTAADARRAYQKQYRATHRESIKAANERYWQKRAAAMNAAIEKGGSDVDTDESN